MAGPFWERVHKLQGETLHTKTGNAFQVSSEQSHEYDYAVKVGVMLLAACWTLICSPSAAAPNSIVPGRSVGHIRLGQTTSSALDKLGKPADSDTAMGRSWSVYASPLRGSSKPYTLDVLTVRDPSGLHEFVEQVRITSPWFKTRQGIGVGSSLSVVRAAFPQAKQVSAEAGSAKRQHMTLYDDIPDGITFEFPARGRATALSVRCRAVLVHPSRKSAFDEYYPWYAPDENGVFGNAL